MNKTIRIFMLLLFVITLLCAPVYSASGYEGLACYRDGVAIFEWHAGLHNTPNATGNVIQTPGGASVVSYYTWNDFIAGQSYMGSFGKSGMRSYQYDNVLNMARQVANRGSITYTLYNMLDHNSTQNYIYPNNITQMRCDGVVEYCYEYWGYKLQDMNVGSNYYCDISKVSDCGSHNINYYCCPKNQSRKMTLIYQ